jgi:hypothetical protein
VATAAACTCTLYSKSLHANATMHERYYTLYLIYVNYYTYIQGVNSTVWRKLVASSLVVLIVAVLVQVFRGSDVYYIAV